MHRVSRQTLLALMLLAMVSACATPITATTDHDRQYDFSTVRKIAIQPINRADPAMVVISDMQVERIAQALTDELQRRGYEVVENNQDADIFLQWHLVTQEQLDVHSFNSATRYNCWSCGVGADVSVRQDTQGTFIVDLVDPLQLRSVWRAVIESRMRHQSNPEEGAEFRREAAQAIFAQFPPD